MPFEQYEAWEAPRIARLGAGTFALEVLETTPALPALRGGSWTEVGALFREAEGHRSGFDHVAQWFGHGVQLLVGTSREAPARPWRGDFDKAEARAGSVGSAAVILGDYLADALWGLRWADLVALDVAVTELTVHYLVLEAITECLAASERMDRAAAEAVMIVEVATATDTWARCLEAMSPLPAQRRLGAVHPRKAGD